MEPDQSEDDMCWDTIKVRHKTRKALLLYQSVLQIEYNRKVSIDEVIQMLGSYAPTLNLKIEEVKKKNDGRVR